MANKTIPQLPEQTGKTNDDLLVIVDSGETTTSKIKISTLLDGVGGYFIPASGTDNVISPYISTSAINSSATKSSILQGTTNTISSTGSNNLILNSNNSNITSGSNSVVVGGQRHDLSNNYATVIGGDNNDITAGPFSQITGGEFGKITAGYSQVFGGVRNEVRTQNCGTFLGRNSVISSGIYNFSFGTYYGLINGGSYNSIVGGDSLDIINNSVASVCVGGDTNIIDGIDRSVILGGQNLTTSYDNEVVCEHLTTSGQSRGNFYNNLSGDTFTIDWDEGNLQKIYMTGDTALTFSNVKDGATYKLQVENGGTHSITGITATGFTILCEGGSIPNITNNGVDLCVLEVMGTDILVRHFSGFATP